jgi:hypothetical protein
MSTFHRAQQELACKTSQSAAQSSRCFQFSPLIKLLSKPYSLEKFYFDYFSGNTREKNKFLKMMLEEDDKISLQPSASIEMSSVVTRRFSNTARRLVIILFWKQLILINIFFT